YDHPLPVRTGSPRRPGRSDPRAPSRRPERPITTMGTAALVLWTDRLRRGGVGAGARDQLQRTGLPSGRGGECRGGSAGADVTAVDRDRLAVSLAAGRTPSPERADLGARDT